MHVSYSALMALRMRHEVLVLQLKEHPVMARSFAKAQSLLGQRAACGTQKGQQSMTHRDGDGAAGGAAAGAGDIAAHGDVACGTAHSSFGNP